MRLGIMQPYFFPYLGHFSLIAHTDAWIVFDVTQYTPKTWMNRNRILHPSGGWNYITVPLANSSISIKTWEASVLNPEDSRRSILGKLSHYKRKAPYFDAVETLVKEVFAESGDDSLVRLNVRGLQVVCRYLGIPFRYRICSELGLPLPASMEAGDWAPEICRQLGAKAYLNPIGGRALFVPSNFSRHGISLQFLEADPMVYDTKPYNFEPNLSIIDVLMWNAPEKVRDQLMHGARIVSAS